MLMREPVPETASVAVCPESGAMSTLAWLWVVPLLIVVVPEVACKPARAIQARPKTSLVESPAKE